MKFSLTRPLNLKASLRLIDTVTNTFTDGVVINEVLVDKDHAVRDTPVWINDNKNFEITSNTSLVPMGKSNF